jgi:carbon-monoxide dehydrogenase large subunit
MNGGHIGRSLRRLEDPRFLTGRGRYVDDLDLPGQLHGIVLRSPYGHAAIEGIDTAAARAMPGVRGVFTVTDLDADGIGPLPCIAQVATVAPLVVPPRRALARDRVRHVGDPVAFVVADTTDQAREATERIAVAYRPLPAVVDARAALTAAAPLLWDEAPGNLSYRFERGDKAAVAAAFGEAAHVVEIELVNNRLVVAPIEPRAAIGNYDAAADRLELLLTGQGVHSLRRQLADAVFHVPPERIVVRAPDVGGGFGVKNFLYPEWVLVLWAARRLGRPVKWLAERGEEFVSSAQGRDNHTRGRLALDQNGRFLALDVDTVANLGAYLSTNGPGSSTNSPASAMGGVYAIPAVFMAVRGVFTNTLPIDAYRGAGKPEANYLIERLVDRAARRLALDPVALRRRNLISHFPYRSGLGVTIDCGRFGANLDEMAQRVLTEGFVQPAARPRRSKASCAGSASPVSSRHRAAHRASAPRSASSRTAASRWYSALSRTARATRPASHRSSPICWDSRLKYPVSSRRTQGKSRAATGMAAPARCIWAAPRSTRRRRWCCPRAARLPPICCRPT